MDTDVDIHINVDIGLHRGFFSTVMFSWLQTLRSPKSCQWKPRKGRPGALTDLVQAQEAGRTRSEDRRKMSQFRVNSSFFSFLFYSGPQCRCFSHYLPTAAKNLPETPREQPERRSPQLPELDSVLELEPL